MTIGLDTSYRNTVFLLLEGTRRVYEDVGMNGPKRTCEAPSFVIDAFGGENSIRESGTQLVDQGFGTGGISSRDDDLKLAVLCELTTDPRAEVAIPTQHHDAANPVVHDLFPCSRM